LSGNNTRIAVIGAGRWGRNLVRVFSSLDALHCVVDTDSHARSEMARMHGCTTWPNIDTMLENSPQPVTAAAIATPAETHTHIGLRCIDAGLDVLVEKPMALSVEDAEHLVERAHQASRVLMAGHLLLHHPAIVALKGLVDAGELGELRYIYSNRLNLGRVRQEENILWSFAPHDIAVILHLVGAAPEHVNAEGGTWLQRDIADVTVTHLDFPNDVKAHVFVSWLHPYKEQKLIVVGSRKMAVFDDLAAEKLVVFDVGIDVGTNGIPTRRQGLHQAVPVPEEEPLLVECRHFLQRCSDRLPPLTDGHAGVDVLRVLSAAEDSLKHANSLQHDRSISNQVCD